MGGGNYGLDRGLVDVTTGLSRRYRDFTSIPRPCNSQDVLTSFIVVLEAQTRAIVVEQIIR